jgi:hypothetical protein
MSGEETVQYGDQGELVSSMQAKLVESGYDPQGMDGYFGDHTRAAVTAFQTDKGLQVDGVCGNQTWGALQGDFSVAPGQTHQGGGGGGPIVLSVGLDGGRVDDDRVHLIATVKNTGHVAVTESALVECELRVVDPSVSGEGFEVTLQHQPVRPIEPGSSELIHFDVQAHVMADRFYQADVGVFDQSTHYGKGQFDFH